MLLLATAACGHVATTPTPAATSEAMAGATTAETATTPLPEDRMVSIPNTIPAVNTNTHNVPLNEIYFDTFRPLNRAVPLTVAEDDLINELRDAIPPIHEPKYETAAFAGEWLHDNDVVLGYTTDSASWAFPVRILNFHEIVNDSLGGEPVLISYCPLCYSGIVYHRELDGHVLTFGNTSALYESDMVMLDYQTGSFWCQVAGEAIVGPLTGKRLTLLPSTMIAWGEWRNLHPDTQVLSRDTGYEREYSRDPFTIYSTTVDRGQFAFPVSDAAQDSRLSPATRVLTVKVDGAARAYPLPADGPQVFTDELNGQPLVVLAAESGPAGAVFVPEVDGELLSFTAENGRITDKQTGSTWDGTGTAVSGPLQGTQLPPLPAKTTFWFAIVAAESDITVFSGH